jgi:simple sugar transport system permease protein
MTTILVSRTLGYYNGFTEVLVHAIPLTLLGLGVAVAFRAGLFNIGGDGQLIFGAVLAVALAGVLAPLGHAGLLLFLAVGFLGGAIVGGLVGWLRARFDANEIIVTIMLNYLAIQLLTWVNRGPLQDPLGIFPRSARIDPALELPTLLEASRVHAGLVVAVLAVAVVAIVLSRTAFGFRLTVLGINPDAAAYAGMRRTLLTAAAMAVSGGLAGLAGAVEIAGLHRRLEDGFADGFGLAAIAAALMARLNPLAVPIAALFFGVFYAGSGALQREAGVPFPIVWIIQGCVVLAFVALAWVQSPRAAAARI